MNIYVVSCVHYGKYFHSVPVYGAYTSFKKAKSRLDDLIAHRVANGSKVQWDIERKYERQGDEIREVLLIRSNAFSGESDETLAIHKFPSK